MLRVICGQDQAVAAWVARRVPMVETPDTFGPCTAIGVVRDGQAIAGVVYHLYRGHDISATIAADDPAFCRRGVLRALFDYPFNQLKVERITCYVGRRNKRSRKLCKGLGFTEEGVMRRGADGREDLIVYGLLKHECKWIREGAHGQEVTKAAARA